MDRTRAIAMISILSVPPPPYDDFNKIVALLLMLLCQTPPSPIINIRNRLFGNIENHWIGQDVFSNFAIHPYEFFEITGETPESLLDILTDITPSLTRSNQTHALSPRNRVLLFMIWLRSYPSLSFLAILFGISCATVSNELCRMRSIMWDRYVGDIVWPSSEEWSNMRGNWPDLQNAVGAIDATSHRIYRPEVEPQALYYSGYRHAHCIHTMVIVDNEGEIRYLNSGFLGHQNDAQILTYMPQIGPNLELDFPCDTVLLADKIFPNRYPYVTPYRQHQIIRRQPVDQRKCRKFNRTLCKYRIKVEHAIREMKIYRVISTLWRHPRWYISCVVELCAAMAVRRRRLFR